MRFAAWFVVFSALSFATPSVAATIIAGANFSYAPRLEVDGTATSVGTFEPFDTSLGALTAVMYRIWGTASLQLYLEDLSPGQYGAAPVFSASFGVLGGETLWSVPIGGLGNAYGGIVHSDGSATMDSGWTAPAGTYALYFNEGGHPGAYMVITEGLELFSASGATFASTVYVSFRVGWPDGALSLEPPTSGTVGWVGASTVEYTYTPVPEPSTALLVGVGLAIQAACRTWRTP